MWQVMGVKHKMKFKEIRQCVICGDSKKSSVLLTSRNSKILLGRGEYIAKQSSVQKTCSRECARKHVVIHNSQRNKKSYQKRMELLN